MISPRTRNALQYAKIKEPHNMTLLELLQTPGLGVAAVTELAKEIQVQRFKPFFPELEYFSG